MSNSNTSNSSLFGSFAAGNTNQPQNNTNLVTQSNSSNMQIEEPTSGTASLFGTGNANQQNTISSFSNNVQVQQPSQNTSSNSSLFGSFGTGNNHQSQNTTGLFANNVPVQQSNNNNAFNFGSLGNTQPQNVTSSFSNNVQVQQPNITTLNNTAIIGNGNTNQQQNATGIFLQSNFSNAQVQQQAALSNQNLFSSSNSIGGSGFGINSGNNQLPQQNNSLFMQQGLSNAQTAQLGLNNSSLFSFNNQVPMSSGNTNASQQQHPAMNLFSHVPTQPTLNNAQYQAQINSTTAVNSSPLFGNTQAYNNLFGTYNPPQQPMQQFYPTNVSNNLGYVFQAPNSSLQKQIYNDDEELIQKVKEQKMDAKIHIDIKAQRQIAKLKENTIMPAMVSLKTQGGSRTSIDLICVIDVSGSMQGQKIDLVKSTMQYVLQALTPTDRLSIITFNSSGTRVCPLKCVSQNNIVSLSNQINNLQAQGGTRICSGLQIAIKTIRQRKFTNKITSVFLLSDGQDKGSEHQFKNMLQQQKQLGAFSIHSFGFGNDHDEQTMVKICQLKDGDFYYIKELATLDEAFSNALGGAISMVATDVVIKLSNVSKNIVEQIKIKKTFGKMWEKINQNEYRIKIIQLMSGISKDYVFQMEIPYIDTQVGDLDRDHDIFEAIFTAKGVDKSNMTGQCVFKLTLLNQHEQIPEVNENVDVIENHLRVLAAQSIEENMKKAQQQKFGQASQGIQTMINCIKDSKKARQQKMLPLVTDLQKIQKKCSTEVQYQNQGKKWMASAQFSHGNQNNYNYSNCTQQTMVAQQKSKKFGGNLFGP